ncbi:MAG: hypothetical protein F6J98_30405 [Moorea sp. SIO4G2]|uniref:hypothetical protein n=1 Tax=unclassified Moorena TaxID=2683338 RepID=UPI0013F6AFB0|nr:MULTISPECIES: hypothetical protein [unclassified Moorena]NEO12454.1 hypothetical protein [Moorena sp. SIO3E8]NEO64491.1 hypothetical protein [Moorena sp. SIO4G2]NEP99303.1 hypothetical protein [Moorena sp. SIO3F7]
MARIRGIGMIIQALIPVIYLLVVIITLATIVLDIKSLVAEPVQKINSALVTISGKLEQTGNVIGSAIEPIGNIDKQLAKTVETIDSIPEVIELPAIPIPDAELPIKPKVKLSSRELTKPVVFVFDIPKIPKEPILKIPKVRVEIEKVPVALPDIPGAKVSVSGLKQTKALLTNNVEIIRSLNKVIGILPNIEVIRDHYQRLIVGEQGLVVIIQKICRNLLVMIILLVGTVLLSLPWLVVKYIKWASPQVTAGWQLLRGVSQ